MKEKVEIVYLHVYIKKTIYYNDGVCTVCVEGLNCPLIIYNLMFTHY